MVLVVREVRADQVVPVGKVHSGAVRRGTSRTRATSRMQEGREEAATDGNAVRPVVGLMTPMVAAVAAGMAVTARAMARVSGPPLCRPAGVQS